MANDYDVIVVGGGPAGYTAAARLADGGLHTALIEAAHPGGLCLNAGCIPTKTLLHTAKLFSEIQHSAVFGIDLETSPALNWQNVMSRKNIIVEHLRNGIRYQMVRHHVDLIQGYATLLDRQSVQVNDETYQAAHLIIATGASPQHPDFPGAEHLLTTTDLLSIEALPQHLVLIGANPIALGLATVFSLCGVEVSIINEKPTMLSEFDDEAVHILLQQLPSATYYHGISVQSCEVDRVMLSDGGQIQSDCVVFAGERLPNLAGYGLENLSLNFAGEKIVVDERMRTNLPGVYAIGDVTRLSMWAHSAYRMGDVVASTILGGDMIFRNDALPVVIYTEPQLACVGLSEKAAGAQGYSVNVAKIPMNYNGRYLTEHDMESNGLCKIVVDAETERILGVHLVGGNASEMIFGVAAMLEDEFRVQDIKDVMFAHPTISEIIKDSLYEL